MGLAVLPILYCDTLVYLFVTDVYSELKSGLVFLSHGIPEEKNLLLVARVMVVAKTVN